MPTNPDITPALSAERLRGSFPGDLGIDADASLVFHESFALASIAALAARYDETVNAAGMALVSDVPAASSGTHALQLVAGGGAPATHLYKSFGAGYDELYLRYYAKYAAAGPWHHSGFWFGGYNPSLPYPDPHAGERPSGAGGDGRLRGRAIQESLGP